MFSKKFRERFPKMSAARVTKHWRNFMPGQPSGANERSEEHTSELQSLTNLVCRLLLEKNNTTSCSRKKTPSHLRPERARSPVSRSGRGARLGLAYEGGRENRGVVPSVFFFFFLVTGPPQISPLFPHPALSP